MNRSAARPVSRALGVGISTALLSALLLVASAHTAGAAGAKFTALTAKMTAPRAGHTATLLPNGQVLITGGFNDHSSDLDTAEVYDPVANIFIALTATMTSPRTGHTATLLPNGQVLLTGGGNSSGDALNTAELYTSGPANTATATATATLPPTPTTMARSPLMRS